MKKPALYFCCVFVLLLTSCGGGGNMMQTVPPPVFPPLNGDLAFSANSQVTNTNTFNVGGALSGVPLKVDSQGNVSGTLAVASVSATVSGACIPAGGGAVFTGKLTPQGQLTLTSAAINGQVINLSVTVSSDGNSFSNGSFTVIGGCLNGDHGTLFVTHLLEGTFTGTATLGGNAVNITVVLGPPAGIPQLSGIFFVVGTATFANNTTCGFSSAAAEGGAQSGLALHLTMQAIGGPVVVFSGSSTDTSATMVSGTLKVIGGPCDQATAAVTLKKA
jgi:hypothetical protein